MKLIIASLIALGLMPAAAMAAPATVLSGEHSKFSRLVTPIQGTRWTIEQVGRQVVLNFEGFNEGFDIASVFELIPRTRIQNVTASGNQLTLALACDCAVSATTERGLYVVVDVADAKGDLLSTAVVPSDGRQTKAPKDTKQKRPPALIKKVKTNTPVEAPSFSQTREDLPKNAPQIIDSVQSRLAEELDTAALRGVLSPAPKRYASPSPTRSQIDPQVFEQAMIEGSTTAVDLPEAVPASIPRNLSNLRISTSRDLPRTFRDLTEITGSRGTVCPPDSMLTAASWGNEEPFALQISQKRQGLYGELDRINPDVAMALAKAYLYFGFGAEARDILNLDPDVAEKAEHLMTISSLMDGEELGSKNSLAELAECQGNTLLWAILAAPVPPKGALPKSNSALRAFNTMPAHLRTLLAPKLNQILLAYGDTEGAATTLRSLERLSGDLPPATKLVQAMTNIEKGETKAGTQQLQELVAENAAQSPQALVALVDEKSKAKQPISAETAELVEAYAQELRGTELGSELRRAHVAALVQSNQFDKAYAASEALGGNGQTTAAMDLRKYMLGALARTANDIVFLDHVFSQSDKDVAALSDEDLLILAERFLALGFAAQAETALSNAPNSRKQKDRQLLSARISLAMGKPFKAQADLIGLDDTEADVLRADANLMSGAHDEAHMLYSQTEQQQEATEAAWLSDDWRDLTTQSDPVFGPTSTLPTRVGTDPNPAGMLSRSKSLLQQSIQARETLRDLLDADELQILSNEG